MSNYLAFVYGGLSAPGHSPVADGDALARQCIEKLNQINNPKQFPPGLLVLLASGAYFERPKADHLIAGVHQAFAEAGFERQVPLIGSTVAATLFDGQLSEEGALLVCLASRLMEVRIAVSANARNDVEGATSHLLENLGLNFTPRGKDPNPLVNRLLLAFFPGLGAPESGNKYPAPALHRLLREKVRARTPIVGGVSFAGVSYADDRNHPGLQFAHDRVYADALVAARLETGFPFTSSIGHGLTPTGRFLRVERLAKDRRTILQFREGAPAEALGLEDGDQVRLLGQFTLDGDPVVTIARLADDGRSAYMLRETSDDAIFEVLQADPEQMREEATRLIDRALHRLKVENPVGCFGIHCAARRHTGLNIERMAADVEKMRNREIVYVGGFFDGEVGMDQTGRSLFGNWCAASLCFGDEMRPRTPLHSGFTAIAEYAPRLTSSASLGDAIKLSLELIYQTGFPGAMISLVMENEGQKWIVAHDAIGARFEQIREMTRRSFAGRDILTLVANQQNAEFIPDSRANIYCDQTAVSQSGIVSQYIIPMQNFYGKTIAVLQIDLGDVSYKESLNESEEHVLKSLGAFIGATIARIHNRVEADVARELDAASKKAISAPTFDDALRIFIQSAIKTFKADTGHIRIANGQDRELALRAGAGFYYDTFKERRKTLDQSSASPTNRAFRNDQALVVNDAPLSEGHQALCREYEGDPAATEALARIGSYANAVFKNGRGEKVGTISLISEQRWFFNRAVTRSLEALCQRLSFLHDHLAGKEAEERARKHLQFLFKVGPQFVRKANFKDPVETLEEALDRFSDAARAEVACLYLWDAESRRFILRAQHGWDDPRWVHAARYEEDERWTGRVALRDEPQYIADMRAYKAENQIDSDPIYCVPMFGCDISEDFNVEVIGLPLKVNKERYGALTLYRRINPRQPPKSSGFTTTDIAVLREAADSMAAMVSALLYYLRMKRDEAGRRRQDEVCEALQQPGNDSSFEQRMCFEIARVFSTSQIEMYSARNQRGAPLLTWLAGCRGSERHELIALSRNDKALDGPLKWASIERRVREKRHHISARDRSDRNLAKTEGLIERVCLPLADDKRLLGMLDLRWDIKHRDTEALMPRHDKKQLEKLGSRLVTIYQHHRATERALKARDQAERSKLAVQAMGAMVFQTAHRLMNLFQDLHVMPDLIAGAPDDARRDERIGQLSGLISSAAERVKRPMEIARQMKHIHRQTRSLRGLVEQVLRESRAQQFTLCAMETVAVPEGIRVWIDEDLIREAFTNIVHNAFKAMPEGGRLTIEAARSADGKFARVTFADTGRGMSAEEIEAALSGFVSTQSHSGLGVLVSLLLIRANDGDLKIESDKGQGTKVIVTLPLSRTEETP